MPQVLVALLRDPCAATFAEAGLRAGMTEGGACRSYRRHQACMKEQGHAVRVAALVQELMAEYTVLPVLLASFAAG